MEVSARNGQRLSHQTPDTDHLGWEARARSQRRNNAQKGVNGRFASADSRICAGRLYP